MRHFGSFLRHLKPWNRASEVKQVALAVCWFAFVTPMIANGQELAKGVIIDKVYCATGSKQNYSVYLPSRYTADKRWPILYAFDPLARGRIPVERFQEAAEKYGYILASSNNSRNGILGNELREIITALWNDTHARFSIDERRVYATGFSGGARVANGLELLCNGCIAGVISCGAGFPPKSEASTGLSYVFFGTIGVDDFNFREMRPLERKLLSLGTVSRIITFDGAHQWPLKDLATEAVEWLELQAIRAGRRESDNSIIDSALSHAAAKLGSLDQPVEFVDRFFLLQAIAKDFKGLRDVTEYERELSRLKDSKEFKSALADEQRQLEKEQQKASEIISLGGELSHGDGPGAALIKIRAALAPLRTKSEEKVDSSERRIARRTLYHIFAEAFEAALYDYVPRKRYDLAISNLEFAIEVYPANPNLERELARVMMRQGSREDALSALCRAANKGFDDADAIEKDDIFSPLREDEKFRRLIGEIRASKKAKAMSP